MCLGMTGVIAETGDDGGVQVALVDTGAGPLVRACLLTCPDAAVGDIVLAHAGYVLRRLDEEVTKEAGQVA
jgi:hydrogenase maturation factor